ncbi:PE family protein [Mycobacterium paraense]|nr:PE family protein [Mycobacterium paraense]
MSFVAAAPETMGAVAGDLAGIGSSLREATAAAAGQTTAITSAAADDVSLAISDLFGSYGQQFQTMSAQAAAFHNEFVRVLNAGAAAYVSTEIANAQQAISGGFTASGAAASTPLLGGLLGLGGSSGSGGLLGGLLGGGSGGGGLLGGLDGLLGLGTGGGGLLGGLSGGLSQLLGPFNSIGSEFANSLGSLFFNPAILSAFPTLSDFIGPINLGNLTPGLSLTSGPLGALLGPTLNGVGLDVGNFLSNELVNGITLTNLFGTATGLFQDVPLLQGLSPLLNSLLPGLFAPMPSGAVPYPNPYTVLGDTTVFNLNLMGAQFASHPFPILNQIVANQNHYAQIFSSGVLTDLQGFPANVPANIQLTLQGAATFNPAAIGQDFVNGTTGFWGTVGSSLTKMGADLQQTIPIASNDMAMAGQAIQAGNYYAAVQDAAHAPIDLFITGFDTSHLTIGSSVVTVIPPDFQLTIAGPVGLEGPAAELLPILTALGQQPVGLASLVPHGSIPGMMLGNFADAIDTLVNANVTANFAVNVGATLNPIGVGATLAGTAVFGLPLQLGFAILGPPFAMANGIAQGATAFGAAAQAGNVLGMLNAIGDMPAYAMNGFLNGQLLVDLPLPIAVSTPVLGTFVMPAVAHVPFDGLLTPPEPLTVTIPAGVAGITVPITSTLGGTEFGGLFPTLFNTIAEAIASAITPTG